MQVFVEAQVEIDALHLAVGDPVEPGADLVVHGQSDRIPAGLLAVHWPEPPGLGVHVDDELLVPPRNDQLPMTVAAINGSASMDGLPGAGISPRPVTHSPDSPGCEGRKEEADHPERRGT